MLMYISSVLTDNIELISRSRRPSHVLTLQHVARETSLTNERKCEFLQLTKNL